VDRLDRGPAGTHAGIALGASVRRAVVHDPEDASGGAIRLLGHDVVDESIKGRAAGAPLATAQQASPMHVPGGQIRPGPVPPIFVIDADGPARRGRRRGMSSLTRLDTGLLIRRDDIVVRPQRPVLPAPLIAIEDRTSALGESRITRKEPAAVAPGPNGIGVQPTPERRAADGRDKSTLRALLDGDRATISAPRARRPPSDARKRSA
jgi:hypothetical protein